MTHIKDVDNDISGDTPTLTKQTTEAFDTWVGTEDLILITKILSLNGSRIRRSYQDARKKFRWFTFPQFSIWVTIGGWSCVEGQGSMCAGVSKITCHHYWRPVGKQMSQTRCLSSRQKHLKSKDKYRRSVLRNTVNKSAGVNRVRVAADCRPSVHLPPLESWAGGGDWGKKFSPYNRGAEHCRQPFGCRQTRCCCRCLLRCEN